MIRTLIRAVASAAFCAAAAFGAAAPALAQTAPATVVAVLDQNRMFAQSLAGKGIAQRLQEIAQQISTELKPESDWLNNEQKALQQAITGLTREQVAQRPDLKARAETFARKGAEFERKSNKRAQELGATENQARSEFAKAVDPIVLEIVRERAISVLLDRSTTMYATTAVDITDEVVKRLDQRVKSIPVTKINLPDPPPPPATTSGAPAPPAAPGARPQ